MAFNADTFNTTLAYLKNKLGNTSQAVFNFFIDVNDQPQLVSASNPLPMSLSSITAGETHIGEVGGNLITAQTEFTRPANTTAYLANYIVSNSTGATTMIVLSNVLRKAGGTGYITGIRLTTNKKSITPRFRIHFFNVNTATVAADGALHKEFYADISKRLGYRDLPAMITAGDTTNSDMSRTMDTDVRIPVTGTAGRDIYAVLETLDGFTPASGDKFTLVITVDNN